MRSFEITSAIVIAAHSTNGIKKYLTTFMAPNVEADSPAEKP
jgi:hypothetical protein